MMKKALFMLAAAASVSALFAADKPKTSLGKLYEKDFLIGVALSQQVTSQPNSDRAKLAASQYNCLTPENCMKWDATEPQEGKFNFAAGDDLVRYAQKNKIKIHGHTLIWHSQTPQWVFQGENGQPATRELVLKIVDETRGRLLSAGNEEKLQQEVEFMLDHHQEYNRDEIRKYAVEHFSKPVIGQQIAAVYHAIFQ